MSNKDNYAGMLKKMRLKTGRSEEDIALALQIDTETYRNWEESKSIPSLDRIIMLTQYLNIRDMEVLLNPFRSEPEAAATEELLRRHGEAAEKDPVCWFFLDAVRYDRGFARCGPNRFFFTKSFWIHDAKHEYGSLILSDEFGNALPFTPKNMVQVRYIPTDYNSADYEIDVSCPLFPNNAHSDHDDFYQTIEVSFMIGMMEYYDTRRNGLFVPVQ